jgi:hypothetical protein
MHILDSGRYGGREGEIKQHLPICSRGWDTEFNLQLIDSRAVVVSERTCGGKQRKIEADSTVGNGEKDKMRGW